MVEHMVGIWDVLEMLLLLVKLGRAEEHDLQSYLQLMDMIENTSHQELAEASNEDQNSKS